MRAQTFLELYRILEGLLEKKYADEPRKNSSVVMEYLSDPESEPVRQPLNLCREIRNLLTHNADDAGGAVVEPSKAVLDSLLGIIDYVQTPQPALHYATPGDQVLCTSYGEPVLELMARMQKRGFSHVPVLHRDGIVGVFSVSSVFEYLLKKGPGAINERTRVTDFGKLLSLEKSEGERVQLMDRTAALQEVRSAFEHGRARNSRLVAVIITEHGQADEPILGLLTPWDVLKE